MKLSRIEKKIHQECKILEGISKQYPSKSREMRALKRAALAYSFAMLKCTDEFEKHLELLEKKPTKEQIKRLDEKLKELGINDLPHDAFG